MNLFEQIGQYGAAKFIEAAETSAGNGERASGFADKADGLLAEIRRTHSHNGGNLPPMPVALVQRMQSLIAHVARQEPGVDEVHLMHLEAGAIMAQVEQWYAAGGA